MDLQLQIRPFRFALTQPLRTAAGVLRDRCGWLLRLESSGGRIGWGEISPLDQALLPRCRRELEALPSPLTRQTLARNPLCCHGSAAPSVSASAVLWRSWMDWSETAPAVAG